MLVIVTATATFAVVVVIGRRRRRRGGVEYRKGVKDGPCAGNPSPFSFRFFVSSGPSPNVSQSARAEELHFRIHPFVVVVIVVYGEVRAVAAVTEERAETQTEMEVDTGG